MTERANIFSRAFDLYFDGFRSMPKWGKQLWLIIFIKLFILFAVFRLFFFPNYLKTNFDTDAERSQHVIERLTEPNHLNQQ